MRYMTIRAEERPQRIRTVASLPEEWSFISRNHIVPHDYL